MQQLSSQLGDGQLEVHLSPPADPDVVERLQERFPRQWIDFHRLTDGVLFTWEPAGRPLDYKQIKIPALGAHGWVVGPRNDISYLRVDGDPRYVSSYYKLELGGSPDAAVIVATVDGDFERSDLPICDTLDEYIELAIRYELRTDWPDQYAMNRKHAP